MGDLTVVDGEGEDAAVAEARALHPSSMGRTIEELMAEASRHVTAVGKNGQMEQGRGGSYSYRRVDDVVNMLHGILAELGIVLMPRVVEVEHEWRERKYQDGGSSWSRSCILTVDFSFHGPLGDTLTSRVVGESIDTSDKASNKAHTAALKVALCQVFLIPFEGDDPDAELPDQGHPEGDTAPRAQRQSRSRSRTKKDQGDGAPSCAVCGETLAGRGAVKKGPDGERVHAECLELAEKQPPAEPETPAEPDLGPTDAEVICVCGHPDHPGAECATEGCQCSDEPF